MVELVELAFTEMPLKRPISIGLDGVRSLSSLEVGNIQRGTNDHGDGSKLAYALNLVVHNFGGKTRRGNHDGLLLGRPNLGPYTY